MEDYKPENAEALAALVVGIAAWIGEGWVLSLILFLAYSWNVTLVQAMIGIIVVRRFTFWRPEPKTQDEYWKRTIGAALTPWLMLGMVWLLLVITRGPR